MPLLQDDLQPKVQDSGVDTKHPDYIDMESTWETMKDVCTSEAHMKTKGVLYVPMLTDMDEEEYKAYLKRAEFPMYAKHTRDSFVGMAMRKDILIDGVDIEEDFFKNIDGKGSTINRYARKLVLEFLQYSRGGTLVDLPPTDPGESIAEAEAKNIKARLNYYNYASIINWKTTVVNNEDILTLVVLEEEKDISENKFGHDTEKQYRVLELSLIEEKVVYTQDIYDNNKEYVKTITPTMNGKPLDFIPFVVHGGIPVNVPILHAIAEQNVHWYMKDADYQHGLHFTALPTPWLTGVDPNDPNRPKTVGPTKLWLLPEGSLAGMLEFSGAGLMRIEASKEETLANITVLSSQILVPKSADDATATAASIRNATETASLSEIVDLLSQELTIAVTFAAKWNGIFKEDITVQINSDFIPLTLSGADVAAYVNSVLRTGFSERTLFDLLKKGEIIPGDRKFEDEMAMKNAEATKRRKEELDQAEALAKIGEKYSPTGPGKDNKDSSTQSGADVADTSSKDKNSGKD